MQGREHDPVIVASIWLGGLHASRAMKAKKRKPVLRPCPHCGQPFAVDPRVGKLHRYCSTPACAKASHTMANAKWLEKWKLEHEGKPYFTGSENCTHVRHWRAVTPKYWRRLKRAQRAKRPQFRLVHYLLSAMRFVALHLPRERAGFPGEFRRGHQGASSGRTKSHGLWPEAAGGDGEPERERLAGHPCPAGFSRESKVAELLLRRAQFCAIAFAAP